MNKMTDKRKINQLIFLCAATYFISYLTRLNYAAVVSAFIAETGISKALAALPVTALSITYGAGQLVSGYLGDHVPPRHIITGGLILTTLANLTMPLSPNIYLMIAVWCINGFAQAMMWPPLVKIMTCSFEEETYNRACVRVSYGSSAGTIAIYLLAPLFVELSGWRTLFYFAAACSFAMAFIWNICMNRMEKAGMPAPELVSRKKASVTPDAPRADGTGAVIRTLGPTLFLIMFAIICQGMIRDGVTTWMPTFIQDTFHLGESISILSGVILPIFSIFAFELTSLVSRKLIRNELACSGTIAALSFVCAILIYFLRTSSAIFSILLMAVMVGCMHGVNLILICMLPGSFSKYGNVSMISGMLNFCTYIGSALSTYGMAKISDAFGWDATILSWAAVSLAIVLPCFACMRAWKKFKES